jgi:hypothetical protein
MRYYIGFLIAIGLSIILILLLFAGGSSSGTKPKTPVAHLHNYANIEDAQASMTVDGPINADSQHQSYEISVTNTEATYQQFSGYNRTLVSSNSYANNVTAFYAFLGAIQIAGFNLGNINYPVTNDTSYCPTGSRTDYRFTANGQTVEHWWTTSCNSGSFEGNSTLVNSLFEAQIPDYGTLSATIGF